MATNKLMVEKILLEDFISTLIDIYDKGVDYIDLSLVHGKVRDRINIIVKDEYLRESPKEMTVDKLNALINGSN